jgi:hypothetical protein
VLLGEMELVMRLRYVGVKETMDGSLLSVGGASL